MTLDQKVQDFSGDMAAAAQAAREREYWLKQLSGTPEKTCFPYDYDRAASPSPGTGTETFRLPGELYSKLVWISNESNSRLLMLLVSGVVLLLNKYSNSDDIIVGMPIYKQEVEGSFINSVLALRTPIQENMTFKELLYSVKQVITGAVGHQNYPMRALLHELNLTHSEENFPLFDIAVIFENIQDPKYIRHIQTNINFIFRKTGEYMELTLEYNRRFYSMETVQRIGRHFSDLLYAAILNMDLNLFAIDLLSDGEKKEILDNLCRHAEGPGTAPRDWTGKTIHRLFEEQAAKTPDNIALVFDHIQLTYRAFEEEANRVAAILRKKGYGTGDIIALLMESSIEMAAAMIGVMKAGAAYLPIDLELPRERKLFMLNDSAVRLILTHHPAETGQDYIPPHIETVNVLEENIRAEEYSDTETETHPSDPAYIIYTSGSTGSPRGVVVEHRQAVNTLRCRKEEYGMDAGVTVLQLFSYAFDGFVTGFFTPVISGSRVVLLSKRSIEDIALIIHTIIRDRVTHFISIPALYRVIITTISPEEAQNIKAVTLAGDKILPDLLETTAAKNKNIEIVNEYGITEAAVWSTVYRHQEKDTDIKIGRPIPHTALYITALNDHSRLLPVGLRGEMCIAGAGVTRGYLNNPELTHRKFVRDPFVKNGRMLKTGDIGRWLPDRNIEFYGRQDFQVKIRGFRIELGEIERRLLQHEHITDSIVTAADEKDRREKYLCAYFRADKELTPSQLRDYLSLYLPAYMVPSYFIQLEKIPLTPNGKIDRKALPKPQMGSSMQEYVPPTDEVEKKLVRIWSEALGIEEDKVGIENDFFEIGGHSLSLVTMISSIHNEFGMQIPVTTIFENPSIKKIAVFIRTGRSVESPMLLLNSETERKLFCFPPGAGFGIAYKSLASAFDHVSFYAFNFIEEEDRVKQYAELITGTQPAGPYVLFSYSASGGLAFQVAKELENQGHEVSDIIMADSFWNEGNNREYGDAEVEFINFAEKFLEQGKMGFLVEKVKQRMEGFLRFVANLKSLEVIHTHIHVLFSEEYKDETPNWDKLTSKPMTTYGGAGNHTDMFSAPGTLEANARILRQILDGIFR